MLTKDEDDFQPSALPDFGDELPLLMASLTRIFLSLLFQSMTTPSLVIPMMDTPWLQSSMMRLLWTFLPKVGYSTNNWWWHWHIIDGPYDNTYDDGKLTSTLLLTSLFETPVNKLSSDSSMHSDSFESVIPATLQTAELQHSTTDTRWRWHGCCSITCSRHHTVIQLRACSWASFYTFWVSSMLRLLNLHLCVITIMFLFGLPDIAPLISTCIGQSPHCWDVCFYTCNRWHCSFPLWRPPSIAPTCLSLSFKTYPHPGKVLQVSTRITILLLQQHFLRPRRPHRLLHSPLQRWTSHFDGSLCYTMLILDPCHPSHYGGYTRDELLLLLQLQFEGMSRRVLELELTPRPPPCLLPVYFDPPHISRFLLRSRPLLSHRSQDSDTHFFTIEQQNR